VGGLQRAAPALAITRILSAPAGAKTLQKVTTTTQATISPTNEGAQFLERRGLACHSGSKAKRGPGKIAEKGDETMRKIDRTRGPLSKVPTQREVLRDVMLVAANYGAWMTLHELSRLTGYGEASISAQLRHLKLPRHGGFALEKRVRRDEIVRSEEHFVVWEYRLSRKRKRRAAARTNFAKTWRSQCRQAQ
jgi:hypothetical protein